MLCTGADSAAGRSTLFDRLDMTATSNQDIKIALTVRRWLGAEADVGGKRCCAVLGRTSVHVGLLLPPDRGFLF